LLASFAVGLCVIARIDVIAALASLLFRIEYSREPTGSIGLKSEGSAPFNGLNDLESNDMVAVLRYVRSEMSRDLVGR
jgi:hypothetical protein